MNKLKYILILTVVLLTSCSNDLDEVLYNIATPDTYGKTESEIATIVGRAYVTLRGWRDDNHLVTEFIWFLDEVTSDEACIPTRGTDWYDGGIFIELHTHTWSNENAAIRRAWEYAYSGISQINSIILSVDQSELTDDQKDFAKAELRGLRAYYYYKLCDWFGNIPMQVDFLQTEAIGTTPRAEVYEFIVSELLDVIPLLPETGYGKFNKGAGYALLARMYLNAEVYKGEPEWQKCIDACDMVTGYVLEGDFFDNFLQENEGSLENIFVIPYDEATTSGENFQQALSIHYLGHLALGFQNTGVNGISAVPGVYSTFEDEDVRKKCMLFGPQVDQSTGAVIIMGTGAPLDHTEEISTLYDAAQNEGVRYLKYEVTDGNVWADSNCDYVLIRYAEVLMMKAEALIRLGNPALAKPLVSAICERAGTTAPGTVDLDFIYDEWLREFMWESLRRTTSIRFGKFGDEWWEKPASDKNHELFPIPQVATTANSLLEQNPGY